MYTYNINYIINKKTPTHARAFFINITYCAYEYI